MAIIATGPSVASALEAADSLEGTGISCRVVNLHTLNPVDEEAIRKLAQETGAIVTVEEHYFRGGLGSIVAQTLGMSYPVPMEMVALDGYAESGKHEQLMQKYGVTSKDVEKAVMTVLKRKRG